MLVATTNTGLFLNLTNIIIDKTYLRTGKLTCSLYCLTRSHTLKPFTLRYYLTPKHKNGHTMKHRPKKNTTWNPRTENDAINLFYVYKDALVFIICLKL
jgi:hypothetical protein